jgi:hypothetical protein
MFYCLGYVHETSPGTHTLFPSYTHFITTSYISVQLSDFGLYSNLVHAVSLKCNKPEFCLVLSSDSISRWTPLALAVSFPLPGGFGDFHPLERVPTGHTIKMGGYRPPINSIQKYFNHSSIDTVLHHLRLSLGSKSTVHNRHYFLFD